MGQAQTSSGKALKQVAIHATLRVAANKHVGTHTHNK